MIDIRKPLLPGTILDFQGILCELGEEIGRGSNALVYQGSYRDSLEPDLIHRVLVKELFPLHPQGKIYRGEDNAICVEPEGLEIYRIHHRSFEEGNKAHLSLLEKYPDQIGANLNSYSLNNTLYTVLGVSGGDSLEKIQKGPALSLRTCVRRMQAILDALETFHLNNMIHLDVSPDNILILGQGNRERAILIDYNSLMLAGLSESADSPVFSIKQGYTAPEIRSGQVRKISFASDLYSVTAVFYRLLTGTPLTNFQMLRAAPPNVMDAPCVKDETETVKVWIQEILRRGLQTIPGKRYQNIEQIRRDFNELTDRIDGVGITHWSLWESGRRQVERMTRENTSLSFIRDSSKLFPSIISDENEFFSADEYFRQTQKNCMLLAGGGMGKTTTLLHTAFSDEHYSPQHSAIMYLSLYGWHEGENSYIINSLLDGMHFHPETHTFEDARKVLLELLDRPLATINGTVPVLILLLDGLNELSGNTKPLLDEINSLASYQGLRLIVAGRQDESVLPFTRLRLIELPDEIVQEALSKSGILLPESADMQKLLHTPMMLSMFIQSCQMEEKQIMAESSEELLADYFSALQEKAIHDLPEASERRWQIEAAVDFVLPAIAAEIHKKQRALEDRELLPTVEKCYRLLNGQLSRRFFPQWIGRIAMICGDAENAEEWYGQITHEILWKQLGLIMRDESGKYMVSHQVFEEYLLSLNQANNRKVRRYYQARASIIGICLCLLTVFSFQIYNKYVAPQPYDEIYAENVMGRALDAYISAGRQYESLSDLTDSAMNNPEEFDWHLVLYNNTIQYKGLPSAQSLQYLTKMLETGAVMPWSRKPMDGEACRRLLTLSDNRQEEYARFKSVLEFVMLDEYANYFYGTEYPVLLYNLLETDADITAELYRIVCATHLTGKYADYSVTDKSYDALFYQVTKQNKHLTNEDAEHARESLTNLDGERINLLAELYNCGAFDAYDDFLDKNESP